MEQLKKIKRLLEQSVRVFPAVNPKNKSMEEKQRGKNLYKTEEGKLNKK